MDRIQELFRELELGMCEDGHYYLIHKDHYNKVKNGFLPQKDRTTHEEEKGKANRPPEKDEPTGWAKKLKRFLRWE